MMEMRVNVVMSSADTYAEIVKDLHAPIVIYGILFNHSIHIVNASERIQAHINMNSQSDFVGYDNHQTIWAYDKISAGTPGSIDKTPKYFALHGLEYNKKKIYFGVNSANIGVLKATFIIYFKYLKDVKLESEP